MSQIPPLQPPGGYGFNAGSPLSQRRTSAAAIASLVLGILGCVPFVTSLLATIFGVVGMRRTRDPMIGGRGLAIAGFALGLVGLLGWSLVSGGMIVAYVTSGPARGVARQFMKDVDAGQLQAAAQGASLTQAELQTLADHMQSKGTATSMTFTSFFVGADQNGTRCRLGLLLSRGGGGEVYEIDLQKTGGKWVVQSVRWH